MSLEDALRASLKENTVRHLRPLPSPTLEMPAVSQPPAKMAPMSGLTKEQLELRRTGIGGSDIGAILGLSPWRSPIDVWRSKVEGWQPDDSPALRRGRILEPAVCEFYRLEEGPSELLSVGTMRHPEHQLMLATPDRIAVFQGGERRLLEVKTSRLGVQGWGEPGTDDIPSCYLAQVEWTLEVVGLDEADVAVLLGGDDFRVYRVRRNDEMVRIMRERAETFWMLYVQPKTPPPADASEGCEKWLKEHFPAERAPLRDATPEERRLVAALREVEGQAERLNTQVNELRNCLRASIGEAEGIEAQSFRVTWRKAKDSRRTDWKAACTEACVPKDVIERHSETTTGSRRLLVKYTEEQS